MEHKKILKKLNIAALNEMQVATITAFEKDKAIILLSPTGTGKTLAFLLPLLKTLKPNLRKVQVLIIAPSRELALQIEQVFRNMGSGFKVNCCYGGHPIRIEKKNLSHPPAVLIGTPGRLLDHIERGSFQTDEIHTLILDEFDKSLEYGFHEVMKDILKALKNINKQVLTSATESIQLPDFMYLKAPTRLNFLTGRKKLKGLTIKLVVSETKDKLNTLFKLLCRLGGEPTLIFCNYRESVERVNEYLDEQDIINDFFHGGLEQIEREETLLKFRNGSYHFLVTTDLAARGLDIPAIKNIIHYHLPSKAPAYIHRNGRTARMDKKGRAFVILSQQEDLPEYIKKTPETFRLPEKAVLPASPEWVTLYIGKGKKDKVNKIDVVGFLSKKGQLKKDELGLIEIKDFNAFAAIKRDKVKQVLRLTQNERIKNKKAKIKVI